MSEPQAQLITRDYQNHQSNSKLIHSLEKVKFGAASLLLRIYQLL